MRFFTAIALVAITVVIPTNAITHWGPELDSDWKPPASWATTTVKPENWHSHDGPCGLWFVDQTSAACCVDRSVGAKFGHCTTSSQHNCPGVNVDATCTTGQNEEDSKQHQGSCPWSGTNDEAQKIYAVCRPADDQCIPQDHHCWGTIACYLNNDPVNNGGTPVDCDQGIYNTKGTQVWTYKEGDFCFETGNSLNTKWCGTECTTGWNPEEKICCPDGYNSETKECNEVPGTPKPSPTCPTGQACGVQDPQFIGFHGQSFQFHGLADEIFNLISTPTLQVNGHFVYISSGKCDYNDTLCWTHPGTYVDQIGMMFQDHRVTFIAGTHDAGLHWKINDEPITKYGTYKFAQSNGADVILSYHHHNSVRIISEFFNFRVVNSDMFFNIEAGLNDKHLLKIGAPRHTITDRILCEKEAHVDESKFQHAAHSNETTGEHNHGAVEAMLQNKYGGIQVPIHGLIGQTWRNALICGRHWIGAVTDYVCSDLFSSDYFFNYFHSD